LLPYRGLGTGVRRALEDWRRIEFLDDRDGYTFTVRVQRPVTEATRKKKSIQSDTGVPPGSGATIKVQTTGQDAPINAPLTDLQVQIASLLQGDPAVSYDEMALQLNRDRTTVMRNIRALKERGILKRLGSRKTGRWEVSEGWNSQVKEG
jgi:ATP-dependent DNA helicase RecG